MSLSGTMASATFYALSQGTHTIYVHGEDAAKTGAARFDHLHQNGRDGHGARRPVGQRGDQQLTITGVSVANSDTDTTSTLQVTLSDLFGNLTLSSIAGLTFSSGAQRFVEYDLYGHDCQHQHGADQSEVTSGQTTSTAMMSISLMPPTEQPGKFQHEDHRRHGQPGLQWAEQP